MAEPSRCPGCNHELPLDAPLGLCPVCLLTQGTDDETLSLPHHGERSGTGRWSGAVPTHSNLNAHSTSPGEDPRALLGETGDDAQPGDPGDRLTQPFPHALGRYRLQSRIGGGGMGDVFRGRDTDLGREIAFKVLLEAPLRTSRPDPAVRRGSPDRRPAPASRRRAGV